MEALIRVMQQTSVPLTADCLRVCESQLDRHTADATTCVPVKSQLTAQTGASVRGTLERRDTLPTIVYTPVLYRNKRLHTRIPGACVMFGDVVGSISRAQNVDLAGS